MVTSVRSSSPSLYAPRWEARVKRRSVRGAASFERVEVAVVEEEEEEEEEEVGDIEMDDVSSVASEQVPTWGERERRAVAVFEITADEQE